MPRTDKSAKVLLQIKISRAVSDRLRERASLNYRTVSQEARMALDEHLNPAPVGKEPPPGASRVRGTTPRPR